MNKYDVGMIQAYFSNLCSDGNIETQISGGTYSDKRSGADGKGVKNEVQG